MRSFIVSAPVGVMSDNNSTQNTTPGTAPDATQSLLSMLGSVGDSTSISGVSTTASPSGIDLLMSVSGGRLGSTGSATSTPLETDIDQLMRSLSDSADVPKVSDEDINKLLGSISADFSTSMGLPNTQTSAPDSDPLAMLSRDLGIDLNSSIVSSSPVAAHSNSGTTDRSTSSAFSPAHSANLGNLSLPNSALSGIQTSTPGSAHHSGPSTPFSRNSDHSPDTPTSQPAKSATGFQHLPYRPSNPRPPHTASPLPAQRPSVAPQRPQRPQRPMQGNRPAPKTRPPFVGGQGAPSGQPRPPQQHHMQRPTQMGHANAGPRPRPSVRPGPGTGDSTDPSRWLAATMSTLPPDQQERLADLFRGLQSKAVDFTTFMRDAEAIMGPKFQDMLVLMRNRGPQASPMQQQQQRVQKFARPQPMPGMQQHATSSAMLRPGAAGPAQGPRPGIPHNLSASSSPMAPASLGSNLPTQAMLGGQLSDVNRNFALARQLLAQHGQASESDQIAGISGIGDLASLISSGSLSQGGSQADAGSGTLAAGAPGGQSFDMVISRWRQIILNPAIPNEQLAKLSMQLSAFGDHLVNATGPMAAIPEEERSQQFAQITKLQALIAQRQYVRGSAPQTPQTESRAGSPGLDMRGKDIKRKGTITMPKPKKRPADPRRQSSPAPRAGIKKQKTGADAGSDSDMETLTSRHGMAGPTLSLDSISSLGASGSGRQLSGGHMHLAGLSVPQESFRGMQGSYVDVDDSMDMSAPRNVISRTSTTGTGGHLSDNDDSSRFGDRGRHVDPMRERMGARDIQRRARERRDRDRSGSAMGSGSGGGDMFSIDDVIGYTGVDLREESEMILGSGMHHDVPRRLPSTYSMANQGPRLSTAVVGGVEVARDRALHIDFANPMVLEALVAKVCKGLHMRAVAADVVPYLSHALQERLRSYMELVSAAAYHRTRTQTLPPPPLDPTTRLPLYKITPHLDVKKQLMVIERVDKIREQVRQQQLVEREQYNAMDHTTQPDNEAGQAANDDEQQKSQTATEGGGVEARRGSDDGRRPAEGTGGDTGEQAKGIGAAKRSRKKDDANETPAYTSKNMPEELQNKISNLTALRAAGGVRKAWMTATSTPDWLSGASVGKQSQRIGVSDKAPPSPMAASQESISGAKRTPSIGSGARMSGLGAELDMGSAGVRPPGHVRSRSSFGAGSDHDGSALATPTSERLSPAPYGMHRPQQPHMPHRSATLAAPLLVTVRDCLFSLERERLGGVRVGRGGGERVLIQAYAKYGHT